MKAFRPLSIACLPLLAAMAPLHAQDQDPPATTEQPAPDSPRPFTELDANQDGSVSKDEAAVDPPLAQMFGTLDIDANGVLTAEEYAAYTPRTP